MRKYKQIRYEITYMGDGHYWWQARKLISEDNLDRSKHASTHRTFRTFKLAFRAFKNCPPGTILTQYFTKNGKRWERDWEKY